MKNVLAVLGLILVGLFVGFLLFSEKRIKLELVDKNEKVQLISKPMQRSPRRVEDDSYMGAGTPEWKAACKRDKNNKTRASRIECMDRMRARNIF